MDILCYAERNEIRHFIIMNVSMLVHVGVVIFNLTVIV